VGPRAGLEGGKSRPHRDSIPDRPARSSVAIPTELPGYTKNKSRLRFTPHLKQKLRLNGAIPPFSWTAIAQSV